ncbi:MAG: hypothetical protein II875_02665 [Clostridia bacterium]|nr:hypothetical protein [Clostridia bacterium]
MIKLAFSPEDDNVRYMIQEGKGKPKCGTVPMSDAFREIYRTCKGMFEVDERMSKLASIKGLKEIRELLGGWIANGGA